MWYGKVISVANGCTIIVQPLADTNTINVTGTADDIAAIQIELLELQAKNENVIIAYDECTHCLTNAND